MTALHWRDVSLQKGQSLILDGVTLGADSGELLGIIGPNGAGKTALLRCAAGLEGKQIAERIDIGGISSDRLSATVRARAMAYLPQKAEAAWPITVAEAVALGRLPHGQAKHPKDHEAIARALDAVGMTAFAQRPLTTLSGGECALVLLARALAVEAQTLLLDEPVAALDPHHQLATMTLLRRLAEQGTTVCVVLHDLTMAARYCHRVALLHSGRLEAVGPPDQVLTDEAMARVYAIQAVRPPIDDGYLLVPWERLPPSVEN